MASEERLNELAEYILGRCNSLDHTLETLFPDVTEDEAKEHLDSQDICLCDVCGWWCDDWSEAEGMICEECNAAED